MDPMIVLVGMYPVVVVVLVVDDDWAWEREGATARPANANVAPSRIDFFIGV